MRKKNNDWVILVIFIVLAILGFAVQQWNTVQVCKNQDVYWIKGTQYSCKFYK